MADRTTLSQQDLGKLQDQLEALRKGPWLGERPVEIVFNALPRRAWCLEASDEPGIFGFILESPENKETLNFILTSAPAVARLRDEVQTAYSLLAWARGYLSRHADIVGRPEDLQELLAEITLRTGVEDRHP